MVLKSANKVDVAITVDVDAIAGWLGSYGGENSLCDLSRGEFAGKVGVLRLLETFETYGIKATWFMPGHSIETFYSNMRKIADAGHEVEPHGYSHENPTAMTRKQEEKTLAKSIKLVEQLIGKKPVGYRAPWWEYSKNTLDLLLKYGFIYDSSLMGDEFDPYFVRKGDKWYPINYSKDPDTWMKPYEFGEETDLVEIPVSWYLDDLPPQMFIKHPIYNYGWTHPDTVYLTLFKDHFDYLYNRKGEGVLTITTHPDVSGRVQGILRLEKLIEYIRGHPRARFRTLSGVAADFLKKTKKQ